MSDEDLKKLASVEDDDSPVRVIVSVGMLKEGWDVKNVYVIASMRSSISEILTEQTLGRGLRLPFGAYTGWELLDTLEVLAHERYQDLLKKSKVINEAFIDHRTRAVVRKNAEGQEVVVTEEVPVSVEVVTDGHDPAGSGVAPIKSIEDRGGELDAQLMAEELHPKEGLELHLPELKMAPVESRFSLADITDKRPFKELGERIAANPAEELRRIRLSAHIVTTADGMRQTELMPSKTLDKISSPASLIPLEDARQTLINTVLSADVVPGRKEERLAAMPLVEAFLSGLGDQAEPILSGYMERAVGGVIELIAKEQKRYTAKPTVEHVVGVKRFAPARTGKPVTSQDRIGAFKKTVGYKGWTKSMYEQVWFDSETERHLANLLDDSDEIEVWVRLHLKDLPIRWEGGNYNPDFVAVETGGDHWVIEVKADRDVETTDVQGKRQAAEKWANHVSIAEPVREHLPEGAGWHYLLASESDIAQAKGDWRALKKGAGF